MRNKITLLLLAFATFSFNALRAQTAPITGPSSVCQGATATFSDATAGGRWSTSNARATVNSTSGVVTGVTPGACTLSYTPMTGPIVTKALTVNASNAITGSTTVCRTQTITLANSIAGGTWSSSNANSSVGSSSGIVTGVTAGNSTVSYVNPSGCVATQVVTVKSYAPIVGSSTVCQSATMTLSDAVAGGTWSASNARATVNSTSGVVTGVSSGACTISYAITGGCTATQTITVSAVFPITGTFNVCQGLSTTLANASPGGTWSSSNANALIGSASGVLTGSLVGTSSITYISPAGCSSLQTVTVNLLQPITGSTSVCLGLTITLSDVLTGGTWTRSNLNVTVGSASGIVTGLTVGTSTISYAPPSTGCVATKVVTINPLPAAISGTTSVCVGSITSLSNTSGGGTWSSSNGNSSVGLTTGAVTGVTAGTSIITYTLPTSCIMVTTVTIKPVPASITGTNEVCEGLTTSLSDGTAGGTWSSVNANATIGSSTGVVTGVTAGTSLISYTMPNGCAATSTATIDPLPAAISGTMEVCLGLTTSLSSTSNGGTWSSSNANADIGSSTGVVTGVSAGISTITYMLSTGCIATTVVTVNPLPADITGITEVCPALTTSLSDVTVGGTWSTSNAHTTVGSSDGVVTGVTVGTSTITYMLATGCIATTVTTVDPLPNSGTINGPTSVAVGYTITLSDAVTAGVWSSSNTTIATVGTAGDVFGVSVGPVVISFTQTNFCGSASSTSSVTITPGTYWFSRTAGGDISVLTQWWSNTNNTGLQPINFTNPSDVWVVQSTMTCTTVPFTLAGDLEIVTGGTLTAPAGILNIGGSWSNSGTFNNNNGTVNMNSTATGKTLSGAMTGSNKFKHLTFNGSGGAWSFGSDAADVAGDFNIAAGTVTAPSTTLQVKGNWSNSGSFTNNSGEVIMNSTSNGKTLAGTMTGSSKFYKLTFNGSGGAWSFGIYSADVDDDFTISAGTVTASTGSLNVNGSWSNSGTFSNNGGTVTMTSTTTGKTLGGAMTGSNKFNNLTFNGSGGAWSFGSNAADVAGDFNITAGGVTAPSTTLQVTGSWGNSGTFTNNGGTVVMNSTTTAKTLGGAMIGSNKFNNLTFNGIGGAWSFGVTPADVDNDFTITNGTVTAPSAILKVGGNWSNSGTFTNNVGTVTMNSTAAGKTFSGAMTGSNKFNNLIFNGSGGAWSFGSTAADVGSVTITAGTVTAPSTTLQVAGSWSNSGTFTNNGGTVVMNSTNTGNTLSGSMTGSNGFNVLTFNGSGGTWTFSSNSADVSSNFTITNGTVTGPSSTLQVTGDFLQTAGSFIHNSGTVVLNGSSSQQIGSSGGHAIPFYNLSFGTSGTKTCSANVSVAGTLTPSGTAVLASNGLLTIKSTSSQTANIAVGSSSGGYITGDVTMERYISAAANRSQSWRLLAVPVTGSQTIQAAWQEGATSGSSNPNPGYGVYLTCNPGYTTAAGFDAVNPSFTTSSIEQYDVANQSFTNSPVTNTNVQSLSSKPGYFLYVRGDRTCTSSNSTITATTLRATGTLYTGDQSSLSVPANKFLLVGNPYASSIDFSAISSGDRTNLNNTFKLWDPKLGTSGGYQTFTSSTPTPWAPTPGGGSYGTSPNSIIQSGQAFFVYATTSIGSLTLREAIKSNGSNNNGFKTATSDQSLRVSLNLLNNDNSALLADGVMAIFSANGSNEIDGEDAMKLDNMDENLSLLRDKKRMVIEMKSLPTAKDTLFLNMEKVQPRDYQFSFAPFNFDNSALSAFLFDRYKNTFSTIDLGNGGTYNFNVNSDSASWAPNRFMVVFDNAAVSSADAQNGVVIYPNPVSDGRLNLKLLNQKSGLYGIHLINIAGQRVLNTTTLHNGGSGIYPVNLPSQLPKGFYNFELVKPDNSKTITKIFIN